MKFVYLKMARPRTCWWYVARKSPSDRNDLLVGLERIYLRPERRYAYVVTLGRLQLGFLGDAK